MGAEVVQNDFKTNTLNEIKDFAQNAYEKMLAKKAEYEASMKRLDVFTQAKHKAYVKFSSAKTACKNDENDFSYRTAKAQYSAACASYSDAEINSDVLRGSLQDSIFYSGKMNNSAAIASAVLG